MRKIKNVLFTLLISTFCVFINGTQAHAFPEPAGEGMVLMDYITGEVIASKNPDKAMAPASTTKTMTALLSIENCDLEDIITVGPNPPFADGSSIGLKEGDKYSIKELLYALMLESGNDVALALAEHIAGTEEEFAKMMNERAKELGAKNTNFVNASGLYDDNHVTSAYDLALIMRELAKHPIIVEIGETISHEMPVSVVDGVPRWVNNSCSLVNQGSQYYYEPIIAGKTGYTIQARNSYVSCAEKNNQRFVLALVNYENKYIYYEDVKNLYEHAFNNYKTIKLYSQGDELGIYNIDDNHSVPVILNQDIYYNINLSDYNLTVDSDITDSQLDSIKNNLKCEISFNSGDSITPGNDITKGEELFKADLLMDGKLYATVDTISGNDVTYTQEQLLVIDVQNNTPKYVAIGVGIFLIVLILLIIIRIIYVKIKRKKRRSNIYRSSRY